MRHLSGSRYDLTDSADVHSVRQLVVAIFSEFECFKKSRVRVGQTHRSSSSLNASIIISSHNRTHTHSQDEAAAKAQIHHVQPKVQKGTEVRSGFVLIKVRRQCLLFLLKTDRLAQLQRITELPQTNMAPEASLTL